MTGQPGPLGRLVVRLRWVLAAFAIAYGGLGAAMDLAAGWQGGLIGLATGYPGPHVTFLGSGSAAARAGVRIGDAVEVGESAPAFRIPPPVYRVRAGTTVTLAVRRGAHVERFALTAQPIPASARAGFVVTALAVAAFGVLGAWVIVAAPSPLSVGLLLYGLGQMYIEGYAIPPALWIVLHVPIVAFRFLGPWGLVLFALAAPDGRMSRPRLVAAGTTFGVAAGIAAIACTNEIGSILAGWPRLLSPAAQAATSAAFQVAAFALLFATFLRRAEVRPRLAWFLAAAVLMFANQMDLAVQGQVVTPNSPHILAASVCTPVAVGFIAYAVVRHHLVDLRFVAGRALVYGVLTSTIVAAIGLVDWLVSSVLSASKLALPLEALAAVGIGFWLNGLHARVESLVDRVFFRARRRAEERLYRVAAGLERAANEDLIAPALVEETTDALALASAALFVRVGDGAYAPDIARGWDPETPSVSPRDPFVLHVAGAGGAFRLDTAAPVRGAPPDGASRPRVVVPILARDGLVAFAVYGSHVGGADLDPDELAILERLARAAGHAFERAEAARMREVNAELRAALAAAMAAG